MKRLLLLQEGKRNSTKEKKDKNSTLLIYNYQIIS